MQRKLPCLVAGLLILTVLASSGAAQWPSFQHDERNTGHLPGSDYAPYQEVWWQRTIPGAAESSPVVQDGTAVIAGGAVLWGLDAATGVPLWNATFDSTIQSTPSIADNRVYAVDNGGNLKVLRLESGQVIGTAKVGATIAPITVSQGKAFVGDQTGVMYAFNTAGIVGDKLQLNWKFDTKSVATSVSFANNKTTCGPKLPSGAVQSAAVVYGGKVIFSTLNNHVYAVNENSNPDKTTNVQWVYKTGDQILGAPAVDHARGNVIVGSFDNKIHAVPASPGGTPNAACNVPVINTARWTFTVPNDIGSSRGQAAPSVAGDRVFVGAYNGRVYALTASNGQKAWEYNTGSAVGVSPAISNGHLVVGNDLGKVIWLTEAEGQHEAEYVIGAQVRAGLALVKDRTYVVASDGKVAMLGATAAQRPDIAVEDARWDANTTTFHFTIRNIGPGEAPPGIARVALDDTFRADIAYGRLAPGASEAHTHVIATPPASFAVTVTADPDKELAEADEDNNRVTVEQRPPPPPTQDPTETEEPVDPGDGGNGGGRGSPGPGILLLIGGLVAVALVLRRRG